MPFIGQDREEPEHRCLTPRCTVFLRRGTLWQCGTCKQLYRLGLFIQPGGRRRRKWHHYPATAPTVEKVNGKYHWEPKVRLPSTVVPVRRKYY